MPCRCIINYCDNIGRILTILQYIYIAVSAVIIPLDGDVKSTYIAMLILFIDSGDNINTPIY